MFAIPLADTGHRRETPVRRSPHLLALLGVGLSGALTLNTAPAVARPTPTTPGIVVVDGMTQPVFSLADAIEERVYVQTAVDTDHDGRLDRVAIDISRPRETATEGFKVPVIFEHSPYRKDVWYDVPYPSVLVDELPQNEVGRRSGQRTSGATVQRATAKANLPGSLDDYYVPRGYAVVLGQSVGTGDSDGCPTSGDQAETLGTRAVIDWLNGRAKGFDAAGARSPPTGPPGRRHDRRLLQRHPAQPGRRHRRPRAADHRAGGRDQQLVRLLPGQRPGGGARDLPG